MARQGGSSFTIDVTQTPDGETPPPSTGKGGRRGSTIAGRRGTPSKPQEKNPEEQFAARAAEILEDPSLATAKESVIRKRAKERIETLKVELQTGAIGPMALDKIFTPVWVRADSSHIGALRLVLTHSLVCSGSRTRPDRQAPA